MFTRKKFLGFSASVLSFFLPFLFGGFVFAAEGIQDADGDSLPDSADPAPLFANLPFHWSVEKISCRFPVVNEPADGLQFPLFTEKSPVRLSRPSSLTVAPAFDKDSVAKGLLPALGLFGRGTVPWEEGERLAVLRALVAAEGLAAESSVDFTFEVHFTNLGTSRLRLICAAVPVELGGKVRTIARPAAERVRTGGFLLPADGKTYRVTFVATMAAVDARNLLAELSDGSESPDFSLPGAKGVTVVTKEKGTVVLDETFQAIMKKTVPVHVEGPAGRSWLWRIAEKRPDGASTTIADWVDNVNVVPPDAAPLRLPIIAFSEDGILLSLAGWDTGNWDDWWQAEISGQVLKGLDWSAQEVKGGSRFYLRPDPPELSRADRQRLRAGSARFPVYSTLLGITLWNEGNESEGHRYFQEAASAGSAQAYSWLGFALGAHPENGSNLVHSAINYKRAAEMGYAPGQAWYGNCLLRGIGTKADPRGALVYLKQAADQKFPEAQALYGLCLLRGIGVEANPAVAQRILLDAAGRGDPTAQYGLGTYLLQTGRNEGLEWVWIAACKGNEHAQMKLAAAYHDGSFGVSRNLAEAARWLKVAADRGSARAWIALGEAYRAGNGVDRDQRAAAGCFLRAAEAGDRTGQTWYALCLLDGLGVRQNALEAVPWLEKAAQQGAPEAQYILGLCLYGGVGGIQMDRKAAVRWLLAASSAQVQARVFLGYCFFSGDGVVQNKEEAVRLFTSAAEDGSVAAQLWLAYCFEHGEGVTINLKEARKWAQAAADQGNPAGREMLERLPLE